MSTGGILGNAHMYMYKPNCRFVCLSVCLSEIDNTFRLKSERHATRHVGPLGTWTDF